MSEAKRDLVIGLDPALKFGWAVLKLDGTRVDSGTMKFSVTKTKKKTPHPGERYKKAEDGLKALFAKYEGRVLACAYEKVRRHMGSDAAHMYGYLEGTLLKECVPSDVPVEGIAVGTIKKLACEDGSASKEKMIKFAEKRWAPHIVVDDNEADALHIAACYLTLHNLLESK